MITSYCGQKVESVEELKTALATRDDAAGEATTHVWRGEAPDNEGIQFEVRLAQGKLGVKVGDWARWRKKSGPIASLVHSQQAAKDRWPRLPGTMAEIEGIVRLFKQSGRPATMCLRSDASEQTLLKLRDTGELSKYGFLHFATHGTSDEQGVRLILAQDQLPDPYQQALLGSDIIQGQLTPIHNFSLKF